MSNNIPRPITEEEKEKIIGFIIQELFLETATSIREQVEGAYTSAFDNVTLDGKTYSTLVSIIWAPGEAEAFVSLEDGSMIPFDLLE